MLCCCCFTLRLKTSLKMVFKISVIDGNNCTLYKIFVADIYLCAENKLRALLTGSVASFLYVCVCVCVCVL
jgi:hypothetical protein